MMLKLSLLTTFTTYLIGCSSAQAAVVAVSQSPGTTGPNSTEGQYVIGSLSLSNGVASNLPNDAFVSFDGGLTIRNIAQKLPPTSTPSFWFREDELLNEGQFRVGAAGITYVLSDDLFGGATPGSNNWALIDANGNGNHDTIIRVDTVSEMILGVWTETDPTIDLRQQPISFREAIQNVPEPSTGLLIASTGSIFLFGVRRRLGSVNVTRSDSP